MPVFHRSEELKSFLTLQYSLAETMATQSSSTNATPALFNQFQGPPQRAYSCDMNIQQIDQVNMLPSENDAEIDSISNDPASSSKKRSGDALSYPRKRATIAVMPSCRGLYMKSPNGYSANYAGGESRVAMGQDRGASSATNYALNASIENRA